MPEARSRLNSVYMTSVLLGGGLGSLLGAQLHVSFGWLTVCLVVAIAGAAAMARHLTRQRAPLPGPHSPS